MKLSQETLDGDGDDDSDGNGDSDGAVISISCPLFS